MQLIQNFLEFCKDNLPYREKLAYFYLGFYCIISVSPSIYNLPEIFTSEEYSLIEISYHFTLFASVILLLGPVFPEGENLFSRFLRQLLPVLWNLSLLNILVSGYIFVIMSNFELLQMITCLMNIMIVSLLLRWKIASSFIFFAFLLSLPFYNVLKQDIALLNPQNFGFTAILSLLFISGIIITLLNPKDKPLHVLETECAKLRKILEDLRIKHLKKLQARDKYVDIIVGESKPVMNYIYHASQKMYEQWEQLSDRECYRLIKYISANSGYISKFINNISDYSKADEKEIKLNFQKINLGSLVKEQIREFTFGYAMEKNINVHDIIDDKADLYAFCDKFRIAQVISNLLINAADNMSYGEITVTVRNHYITINKNNFNAIYVVIKDNGSGIPEKEMESIFATFTKGSMLEDYEEIKKGFGLALCSSIINAHYGKIIAYNNDKGGGSSFIFAIPKNYKEIPSQDRLAYQQKQDSDSMDHEVEGIMHEVIHNTRSEICYNLVKSGLPLEVISESMNLNEKQIKNIISAEKKKEKKKKKI